MMYEALVLLNGEKRSRKCILEENNDGSFNAYFSGKSSLYKKNLNYFKKVVIKRGRLGFND